MKTYRLTLIGLALAIIVFTTSWLFHLDLFEKTVDTLHKLEKYDIDEFVIPLVIFISFAYFDQIRIKKDQLLEIERGKIYKAMLYSVHHVLNNFLNQMQLFRIEAEDTPGFNKEILSLYDDITGETSKLIKSLGSITRIDEESIIDSVAPKS